MRTTLTLDDDVEAKLRLEARRTGRAFKEVVNDALRSSLQRRAQRNPTPFKVKPRDLGDLRPEVSLDNVGDLLELLDGPSHR